jgi:RHS repeat-associated protein
MHSLPETGSSRAAAESRTETCLYYYRARYYDPNVGRFLSEDPLGSGGGLNFYGYVGNRSTNLKDIFGLDYSTSRNGNTIIVNASITLYGPGANDALAAKWQRDILDVWNNNIGYGKCDVIFNVQVIADPNAKDAKHASSPTGFPGANNFISVPDGSPSDLGNPSINFDWGSPHTGTIPSGTLGPSVAHEFGHLLHLYDSNLWGWHWNLLRPKSDIMNEVNAVGRYDIDRIVGGGKASTCGCQ